MGLPGRGLAPLARLWSLVFVLLLPLVSPAAASIVRRGVQLHGYDVSKPFEVAGRKREVVAPFVDTRVGRQVRSAHGHFMHRQRVDIAFSAFGREVHAELELFEDLIHPDYHVIYGGTEEQKARGDPPNITYGVEHCYYRGKVNGRPDSWLALSTCNGELEGVFYLGRDSPASQEEGDGHGRRRGHSHDHDHDHGPEGEDESQILYISPALGRLAKRDEDGAVHHVVYRREDLVEKPVFECGHGDHLHEAAFQKYEEEDQHVLEQAHEDSEGRRKRDNFKYVELFVYNDFARSSGFGTGVVQDTINLANIVSQRYIGAQFGAGPIAVKIIGQFVSATEEFLPGNNSPDANQLLDAFTAYRRALIGKDNTAQGLNDNAQLFSGRDFTSGGSRGVAGLAWVGTMCSTQNSCGINEARLGSAADFSANIIAHEMGHNFNSNHDSSGNTCPQSGYIMAAVLCSNCPSTANQFSTCSYNSINTFLSRATCLTNSVSIQYPDDDPCGNFMIDSGETCDFGPSGSTCCAGKTAGANACKWKSGASCDNSSPCCTNCNPRPTTHVCRTALGECDVDDFCSIDGKCTDMFKPLGTPCSSNGICSQGTCVSRDQTCAGANSYTFTIGTSRITGPFTSCGSDTCFSQCRGSDPNNCISFRNFGLPDSIKIVPNGLPCKCASATAVGMCQDSNCICTEPTSPPPASTPAPTSTRTTTTTAAATTTTTRTTTTTTTTAAATTTTTATPTATPTPTGPPCDRAYCNDHGWCISYMCVCDSGWAGTRCTEIPGCDGVANSGKVLDACGICGGDGSSCADCLGVPNGNAVRDRCGVCNGNNTCLGCDGVPNSGKRIDTCGVCGGNNSTCAGCDGVPLSGKTYDQCGVCGGNSNSCRGCDGIPNSGKVRDACGVCGGDDSSCLGCDGVPNSGKIVDRCGVCGGDDSTCKGCDGVVKSGKKVDACGVCGGNNSTCAGCDGVPNSGKKYDPCGVCGGNGSGCAGCDGVPNSGKVYDRCNVCGGTNACVGCDGVPNSGKVIDQCNVCGGNGTSCLGCDGVKFSGKIYDLCGVCGGNNTACMGCDGRVNSGKVVDLCGICGGDNSTCKGCDGVINSGKLEDQCGVCGGDGRSCLGCDGVPFSGKVPDVCGVCNGGGTSCTGCDGVPNSGKRTDACGICGGNNSTCIGCDGVINSGKTFDFCGVCGGDGTSCTGGSDPCTLQGKKYDRCGVCGGQNECIGCDNVPDSGKVVDLCNVCGGNNSSCAGCDGVPNSGKTRDACNECGGTSTTCVGCDGIPNSPKRYDACGICGGTNITCMGCDGVPNSGLVRDVCGSCGGDGSICGGYEPIVTPLFSVVDVNNDRKTFNITCTRMRNGTLVYYTLDGTEPNILTSIRYQSPFLLDVSQFRTPSAGGKPTRATGDIVVTLRVQAFPPPSSSLLYKSQIYTTLVTFDGSTPNTDITDGDNVTGIGLGVIVGSAVGGGLALGIIFGAIAYAVHAKKSKSKESAGRKKYKALYEYKPTEAEEIELRVNDIVVLHKELGSGWASGYNERSRKTGVFPFEYIAPVDTSRMMLAIRPQTVYSRVSRAFGGGRDQDYDSYSSTTALPTTAPPPKPPKPYEGLPPPPGFYKNEGSSHNPLYDNSHY